MNTNTISSLRSLRAPEDLISGISVFDFENTGRSIPAHSVLTPASYKDAVSDWVTTFRYTDYSGTKSLHVYGRPTPALLAAARRVYALDGTRVKISYEVTSWGRTYKGDEESYA